MSKIKAAEGSKSHRQSAWRRLRRNRPAMAGAVILATFYLMSIFAGFFSPYSPTADEFRSFFFHPPTPVHFRDATRAFHLRPYVARTYLVDQNRLLYSSGVPLYLFYRHPTANQNPYLRDTLESNEPILTVIDERGKSLAMVTFLQETAENSGTFSAVIPLSPVALAETRYITVQGKPEEKAVFPVLDTRAVTAKLPETATFYLKDQDGNVVNAFHQTIERFPVNFWVRSWRYDILWIFHSNLHLFGVEAPGHIFLLGTDQSGRDLFSRILFGAQISLTVGLVGVFLTTLFGLVFGGIAGYYGGSLDNLMMRFAEILLSIPALYLILTLRNIIPDRLQDSYDKIRELVMETFAWHRHPVSFWLVLSVAVLCISYYCYSTNWKRSGMVVGAFLVCILAFGPRLMDLLLKLTEKVLPGSTHLTSQWTYLLIIAILSTVGWAGMSRVVRGMVLSIREQEYVLAARSLGASDFRIIARQILPGTIGYVIVRATLLIPVYILSEVALSFLGVGVQEPTPSWGNMLTAAQNLRALQQFTWILAPGVLIFFTVLAFNFLGDGLLDMFRIKDVSRQ